MSHRRIYEDHSTFTRTELANELHRIAAELESGADLHYGTAGNITVSDEIDREVEIDCTKDGAGFTFKLMLAWHPRPPSSVRSFPAKGNLNGTAAPLWHGRRPQPFREDLRFQTP